MKKGLSSELTAVLARAERQISRTKTVVGLDGFVDTILHVVDKRQSATKFTRVSQMGEFSRRIGAAAGLSANFEMVVKMLKLGGNGPIMANALSSYGLPITYVGNLGSPQIHPVFADFAKRVKVHSLAEPGYTDAVEFDDGKLMLGKLMYLAGVNWPALIKAIPEKNLLALFQDASLIAMVNWTMLPFMGQILDRLLAGIVPKLKGEKRWVFFDLADPAKRTPGDIKRVIGQIKAFQKHCRVIFGLNFNESRQIGRVLGIAEPEEKPDQVASHAAKIRAKLGIETVVIHPVAFAAASDAETSVAVPGPYVPNPKITTGAGDHFNAGFCLGRVFGGGLKESLQFGVATSGFYVRQAKSPTLADLRKFLPKLPPG